MNVESPKGPGYRFGVFEVDTAAGELRRRGRKVRIQDKPLQLLLALLRSPGEVVTREELQRSLWPADTFVDFELGLNTAVKKIRRALGDSVEHPHYVETVPRRGYRFLAPVEPVAQKPEAMPPASAASSHLGGAMFRWVGVGGGAVLLVAAVAWWVWPPGRGPASSPAPAQPFRLRQVTRDSGLTGMAAFSLDGKWVTYASDRAQGNLDIWIQQAGGSSALRLTDHPASDYAPAFSPDGRQIVFRSERDGGGILVVPSLGGEARRIAAEGFRPRFSPDGRWILYVAGTPGGFSPVRTFAIPAAGGPARRIRPEFQNVATPVWTPDGNILFVGGRSEQDSDLWVTSLDGRLLVRTHARRIFEQQKLGFAELDDWAVRGHIVFSAQTGDSLNLWRLTISPRDWQAKGPAERLTFGVTEMHARSGPGDRLVFSSGSRRTAVWGLPVALERGGVSGALRRLTDGGARDHGADVSRNGQALAFRSNRSGSMEIWCRRLGSGREVNLTSHPGAFESMPAISRDGEWVAYEEVPRQKGAGRAIFVVPSGGGPPRRVCDDCGAPQMWSADGKQILYLRAEPPRPTVHLLDLTTGQHSLLLEHPELPLYVPRWSPDGRWLVCKADLDERRTRLYVVPLPAGRPALPAEWIPITEGESWDDLPRWSPRGQVIYYVSTRDGFRCLWARRLHPETRRPVGAPFSVRHFHEAHLSMLPLSLSEMQLSLGQDLLVFPLAELRGNVWMMEPETAP